MMRMGPACCLLFVLVVSGAQTAHRAGLEEIIRMEDRNPAAAGAKLASESAATFNACPMSNETELGLLTHAIFAVETRASGRLKRFIESSLVRASLALRLDPPNFSIGVGQIRPSTVDRLKRLSTGTTLPLELTTRKEVIRALLEPCEALLVGSLIIEHDIAPRSDIHGFLPRSEVLRAARIWNGQSADDNGEAAFAGLRYQELVYETFVALRWARPPRPGSISSQSP